MLDTLFDKIYVVWGRDPARKKYIQEHFKKCDIENYKFIRSITPDNLFITRDSKLENRFKWLWDKEAVRTDHMRYTSNSPYPISLAEICCSYGHLKAYKTAVEDKVKTFLIIEDDAIMDLELCLNALDWKESIPRDWDIIHFHSWRSFTGNRETQLVKNRKQVNDYFYTGYVEHGGTVCYSLKINIAKQLLARYYPIMISSDGMTASLSWTPFARKFYNSYVFDPFLCINTLFDSQIDNEKQISEEFITRNQRYSRDGYNPELF